jgi:hypothetical protein
VQGILDARLARITYVFRAECAYFVSLEIIVRPEICVRLSGFVVPICGGPFCPSGSRSLAFNVVRVTLIIVANDTESFAHADVFRLFPVPIKLLIISKTIVIWVIQFERQIYSGRNEL